MRVGHLNVTRRDYYDRAPVVRGKLYAATLNGPTATTTRWSYTVPSNLLVMLDAAECIILALTSGGAALDGNYLNLDSGSGQLTVPLEVVTYPNLGGERDRGNLSQYGIMTAGMLLTGVTYQGSASQQYHSLKAKLTEYAAY